MAQGPIHSDQTREQRHFIKKNEMAIRASNREILGKKLPHLDKESYTAWPSRSRNYGPSTSKPCSP